MEFKVGDIVTFVQNPSFNCNEQAACFEDHNRDEVSLMLSKFKHYKFTVLYVSAEYLSLYPSKSDTVHHYRGSSSIRRQNLRHVPTLLLRRRIKD